MSPIISEEDVLSFLVLVGARPLMTNAYAPAQILERDAWRAATPPNGFPAGVAEVATSRMLAAPSLEAAIADSERRWDLERATDEVLRLASAWERLPAGADSDAAVDLASAVRWWRTALFRINPTTTDGAGDAR